jgi:small subunit ribosomal protein S17
MSETKRKPLILERGTVTSKSGEQTIRVTLEYQTRHPKYGKILRRRTSAHVHDEGNKAQVGDLVDIVKCRPLSKTKNWRLIRIVEPG